MIRTYQGKEKYIFASYRHADAERVYPILAEFEKRGLRFWYDAGIHTGDEWDEVIDEHIENSHAVIVFVSKAYFQSRNCREELKFARNLEKRLLMVYLEDAEPPRGLRMRLSGVQAIFYHRFENKNEFYEKFFQTPEIRECQSVVQKPKEQTEEPPAAQTDKRTENPSEKQPEKPSEERTERQAATKKSFKTRLIRRKKRLEAKWNALPGGKGLRALLNLFFTVEILMLILANIVVLEGSLQYGYFQFRAAGCKFILSADGIRIAAGAIAIVILIFGILFFRKRMKSFWKYIVWTFVSLALFANMGFWRSMQREVEWKYASGMECMHILMGPNETHRGSFWAELENEVLTIPRDINLVEIKEFEKEYGISWEEWDVTVLVETNAAPCENVIYQGKHVDNGSRIEVQIPLSKLQCDYGLLIIALEGIENKGVNLIFGSRPATWYQELFYRPDRISEAANYDRMFSKESWEWIVKSDAVEVSPFANFAWTAFITSPLWSSIGILLLVGAVFGLIWFQINMRMVSKLYDEIENEKKMYLWIAIWMIGSLAVCSAAISGGLDLFFDYIFKIYLI